MRTTVNGLINRISTTRKKANIIKGISNDFIIIGESGIKNHQDIKKYNKSGIYNFLIGHSILKSKNIEKKINELLNK